MDLALFAEVFSDIMTFVADLYSKIMQFVKGFNKHFDFETAVFDD